MTKLIIVGVTGITHLGSSFLRSAKNFNLECRLLNVSSAYQAPKLIKTLNWYLRGRYPSNLQRFSQEIFDNCRSYQPQWLLTTGISPIDASALKEIGKLGIRRLNFLTDDPWNQAHYAPWFFKALPHYDIIFSPRRANINDLLSAGCRQVEYLPFGYDPELFYPETGGESTERPDIVFAGGGDSDRIPYISSLIDAGFSVDLYGSYWERYSQTKGITKGQTDVPTLRRAIQNAKIALCIVRHANRDGHCMRTFEVPAIGTCMLTEDTPEHREIFGSEGEAVIYFKTLGEMVEKAHWLLNHETERLRLAQSAHQLVTQGGHTYGDRLKTILSFVNG